MIAHVIADMVQLLSTKMKKWPHTVIWDRDDPLRLVALITTQLINPAGL